MICIDLGTNTTKALAFPEDQFSVEELLSTEITTLQTSILLQKDDQYSCGSAADSQMSLDNVLSYSTGFNRYLGHHSPIALTNFQDVMQYFSPSDLIFRFFSEVRNICGIKGCDSKDLSTVALSFPASYTPSIISSLYKEAELSGFCRVLLVPEGEAAACYFLNVKKTDFGKTILIADWGWDSLKLYLLNKDSWGRYVLTEHSAIIPDIGNQIISNDLILFFMNETGITEEILSEDPQLCGCIEKQVNNGVSELLQRHDIPMKVQTRSANYLCSISQNQYQDIAIRVAQKVRDKIESFLAEVPPVLTPHSAVFVGGGSQYPLIYDFITESLPQIGFIGNRSLSSEAVIRGLGIHAIQYKSDSFYYEKYV